MKLKIKQPQEIEARFLRLQVAVNYGEEDIPNDTPGRKGDYLEWTIDLKEDKVLGFAYPTALDVYMKVVDSGSYQLLDENQKPLITMENEYVPSGIGEYGDYLKMKVAPDGSITGWDKNKLGRAFQEFANKNEDE